MVVPGRQKSIAFFIALGAALITVTVTQMPRINAHPTDTYAAVPNEGISSPS